MIVSIFLFWRLGLFLVTYLGSKTFPLVANNSPGAIGDGKYFNYWLSWAQWDGGNYLSIAAHGYQNTQYYAFAPLFPLSVKFFSLLLSSNIFTTGLVIANVAFVIFLLFFNYYLKRNYSLKVANSSLVTFLTFPTAFFGVAYYSESLFLLFVIVFLIFLSRRNYTGSAILVIFASLTRFIGIFLTISMFYTYLLDKKFRWSKLGISFASLFFSFIGIFSYMVFMKFSAGHYLQFLLSQSFWQRTAQDPVSTIFSYLWSIITLQHRPINDYFDLISTVSFIFLLIWGVRRISTSLWLFSTLAILIPASTGTLSGIPRYQLASIGSFIIIGQMLEEHPKLKIPFWTISLLMQALLAVLFINGHWVA